MKTLIIAEAGVNHNGCLETAKKLIDVAAKAGADIIKFQTFKAENIASKFANKAAYQEITTDASESQLAMLKKLELSQEAHTELINHCEERRIQFLSAPFDIESIDFLESLNIPFWKIPSGEITNLPYLLRIAKTGKDIILSSGMSTLEEIRSAIEILRENNSGKITVLHCNTEYPTPFSDVNLCVMETIQRELGVDVGYSDHTKGIEAAIAAAALGAVLIEKHFTLDKYMEGPDHKASLEPNELTAMVSAIRNVEMMLGKSIKEPSPSEQKNMVIARKSIVAKCEIKAGETFNENNITVKRPGNGISPMKWFEILGQKALRNFMEDELIEL